MQTGRGGFGCSCLLCLGARGGLAPRAYTGIRRENWGGLLTAERVSDEDALNAFVQLMNAVSRVRLEPGMSDLDGMLIAAATSTKGSLTVHRVVSSSTAAARACQIARVWESEGRAAIGVIMEAWSLSGPAAEEAAARGISASEHPQREEILCAIFYPSAPEKASVGFTCPIKPGASFEQNPGLQAGHFDAYRSGKLRAHPGIPEEIELSFRASCPAGQEAQLDELLSALEEAAQTALGALKAEH